MSSSVATMEIEIEELKKYLRGFSKLLRRDFLACLVRISAKEMMVHTVRDDWRTRDGTLTFLANSWKQISQIIKDDTFLNWYCHTYEKAEKTLSNRQFVSFLHENWEEYSSFFKAQQTIHMMQHRSSDLDLLIKDKLPCRPVYSDETFDKLYYIISLYHGKVPKRPKMVEEVKPVVYSAPSPSSNDESQLESIWCQLETVPFDEFAFAIDDFPLF